MQFQVKQFLKYQKKKNESVTCYNTKQFIADGLQAQWDGGRILLGDNTGDVAIGLRPVIPQCVTVTISDRFPCVYIYIYTYNIYRPYMNMNSCAKCDVCQNFRKLTVGWVVEFETAVWHCLLHGWGIESLIPLDHILVFGQFTDSTALRNETHQSPPLFMFTTSLGRRTSFQCTDGRDFTQYLQRSCWIILVQHLAVNISLSPAIFKISAADVFLRLTSHMHHTFQTRCEMNK